MGGNVLRHMDVSLSVLREPHRYTFDLHAMMIDGLRVVRVTAGKADHPPGDHVAFAAINRIAEKSLNRHFQQHVEEHGGGYAVEIMRAGFQGFEISVLSVG